MVARGALSCGIVLAVEGVEDPIVDLLESLTGVSLLLAVVLVLLATRNPLYLGVNFKLLDAEAKIGFILLGVADEDDTFLLLGVAVTEFLVTDFNTLGVFLTSLACLFISDPGVFRMSLGLATEFSLGLESKGFFTSVLALGLGGSMFSLIEDNLLLVGLCFTATACTVSSLVLTSHMLDTCNGMVEEVAMDPNFGYVPIF